MEIPWNGHCQQCFKKSMSYIMSMYSERLICADCKDKETKRPDYQQAVDRDLAAYMDRVRTARGF
jgi:hypothetical protein